MNQGRANMGGFTLLEVLVALTLLVVLIGALYGGMRVALRSWDALQQHNASTEQERFARNWLRRLISGLQVEPPRQGGVNRLRFEGRENRLRFVSALPVAGRGGLYVVGIAAETVDSTTTLISTLERADPEATDLAGVGEPEVRELRIGTPGLRFEYFGVPAEGDELRWYSRWSEDAVNYPSMIRLANGRAASEIWPELVVPVRGGQLLARSSRIARGGT